MHAEEFGFDLTIQAELFLQWRILIEFVRKGWNVKILQWAIHS